MKVTISILDKIYIFDNLTEAFSAITEENASGLKLFKIETLADDNPREIIRLLVKSKICCKFPFIQPIELVC